MTPIITSLTDLTELLEKLDWPKELILSRKAFNFVWDRMQPQCRGFECVRFNGVLIKSPPLTDKAVDLSTETEDE